MRGGKSETDGEERVCLEGFGCSVSTEIPKCGTHTSDHAKRNTKPHPTIKQSYRNPNRCEIYMSVDTSSVCVCSVYFRTIPSLTGAGVGLISPGRIQKLVGCVEGVCFKKIGTDRRTNPYTLQLVPADMALGFWENDSGIGNPIWFSVRTENQIVLTENQIEFRCFRCFGNRFPENPVPCLRERAVNFI
jgi:hypothetical protein